MCNYTITHNLKATVTNPLPIKETKTPDCNGILIYPPQVQTKSYQPILPYVYKGKLFNSTFFPRVYCIGSLYFTSKFVFWLTIA